MTPSLELHGRSALVINATTDAGRSVCELLGAAGAHIITHDIDGDVSFDHAAELLTDNVVTTAVNFDPLDAAQTAAALNELDRIDICIVVHEDPVPDMLTADFVGSDPVAWADDLAGRVRRVANVWSAVMPGMLKRGWGRMIAVLPGDESNSRRISTLTAANAAVSALAGSVAREAGRKDVTSNCITLVGSPPALTSTRWVGRAPLLDTRRTGPCPGEAAALVGYLVAPSGRLMSGKTIPLTAAEEHEAFPIEL